MKDELFIVGVYRENKQHQGCRGQPRRNSVGGARGEQTVKSDFPAFATTEAAATSVCESREAETLPRVHGVSPEPGWQSWQKLSSGLHLAPLLLPLAPPSPRILLLSRDRICRKRPFPSSRLPKPMRAALKSVRQAEGKSGNVVCRLLVEKGALAERKQCLSLQPPVFF